MFAEPSRSPLDINFRLFGTPIRVHWSFWLVTAIIHIQFADVLGIPGLLIFIACAFFSTLLHELGHILVGRFFGSRGHIVLYSMGGVAIPDRVLNNRAQRIAVALGGPFAQLLLFAILLGLTLSFGTPQTGNANVDHMLQLAITFLLFINVVWPIFNLIPIFPLDGGVVCKELFEWISPRRGFQIALVFSITLAGVLVTHCVLRMLLRGHYPLHPIPGGLYMALIFGNVAFNNIMILQQLLRMERQQNDWQYGRGRPQEEDWDDWDRHRDRWER